LNPEKVRVALMAGRGAVVAVTDSYPEVDIFESKISASVRMLTRPPSIFGCLIWPKHAKDIGRLLILLLSLLCLQANAAVLPQDRSDVLYHSYQGDGVSIDGPSILLRKKIGNKVSLSTHYYVDSISGASIDVRATASQYREERTEQSIGVDFLHDKTLMSLKVTNSSENDFEADSIYLGISQDFFGDLTTVKMSYSRGEDDIRRTGDETFFAEASRQKVGLALTQVATKNLILGLNYENVSDNGFLNNPYRSVRFIDPNAALGFSFAPEVYPNTRSSNALSFSANYYLPYRAAIYTEIRTYSDTWGINATNAKLGYIHTFGDEWIVEVRTRFYQQDEADFFQDLFTRENEFNFLARDKELSRFDNISAGLSVSYEKKFSEKAFFKKATLNYELDHIRFDYDNFRNVLAEGPVGEEPLFSFSANVMKIFFSIWY
jgi:hypothetical protein